MAAAEKAAAASGADVGDGLRRRNVPGQPIAAESQLEIDDKKKQAKQVRLHPPSIATRHVKGCANLLMHSVAISPANARRVGVCYRPGSLYLLGPLYSTLQDRHFRHRDVG